MQETKAQQLYAVDMRNELIHQGDMVLLSVSKQFGGTKLRKAYVTEVKNDGSVRVTRLNSDGYKWSYRYRGIGYRGAEDTQVPHANIFRLGPANENIDKADIDALLSRLSKNF